ncbi:MAG: leucyl/phenylalanyl-tRNA--protein transferase [Phycisphaerales bacterium]
MSTPLNTRMLEPETLLSAYCRGLFPMADSRTGVVRWYSAERRGILPIDRFHIPRRLRKTIRQEPFRISADSAFAKVMLGCAMPRSEDSDTWISDEIIEAYTRLHELGWAHSVEAWREDELVGGIYGVSIHAAFFGESMFCRPDRGGDGASKIALASLVGHLRRRGYRLFDAQFWNPHLDQFGCEEVSRPLYSRRLKEALERTDVTWGDFDPAAAATAALEAG